MIRVNLSGKSRKKAARAAGVTLSMPASVTPVVLLLIILGSAGGGYWWYSMLTSQVDDLESKIRQAEAQRAQLAAVIKADQIYESRKKILDKRVKLIKGLQGNQKSPVVALDALSEAVDKTRYVWLSTLDQNEAILSMTGLGTSLLAIADFYSNLHGTGYFRNIDVSNAQDSAGNFTFALKCEFAPPGSQSPISETASGGAN